MRLVQLAGPSGGPPLSFHQAITVVGGLDDDCRSRLLDVFRALPAGRDPGWEGLIEAHGVVLDLDQASLRLLGLQHTVDVVVGPDDLPSEGDELARHDGAIAPLARGPEDQLEGLRLSHDILAHGVAALKRTRIEFEEARLQAVEAIEEARADLDPFATTAFEQAAGQLRRAEDADDDDEAAVEVEAVESIEDLEAERDRLQAEVEALDGVEVTVVLDALHRVERAEPVVDGTDVAVVETLAEQLAAAEDAVRAVEDRRRDEGRDPAELLRRIEQGRIQLQRLEASSVPPAIEPVDMADLERAHDEVIDADSKVSSSRIGGKAARQRLDEALAEEQSILNRMGFPTYSAFALAKSAPGPDPETRVELEATRTELAECEAAYHQLTNAGDDDGELVALTARRDDLRRDAGALVDAEPDGLVEGLRALSEVLTSDDELATAVDDLRAALVEGGVDFGDLDLSDDEVVDVARVWLADMQALTEDRATFERELDTVQARLLVVAPVLNGDGANTDPRSRAQAEVEAAEDRLARHRQASDRVAELCGLLEEIESKLAELGENIGAQEALVAAADEGMAATEAKLAGPASVDEAEDAQASASADDPGPVDEVFGLLEDVDDTEWYLLTRLAGLRALSFAGSVPLVLDGALAAVEREVAHRVLDKVAQMTDVVQVVYLGDDDAVVEWAALRGVDASVITASALV